MELISTTTRRSEGRLEITFVLDDPDRLTPSQAEIIPVVNPERRAIVDRLDWESYTETLFKIVPQPNGRVHVHFVYLRRS